MIMNKGIITKIEKKFMIVKTSDNKIERLKRKTNMQVGQNIAFTNKDIYRGFSRISYRQIGTSVSMFIILVVVGVLFMNQTDDTEQAAIISLDINPGINFAVNSDLEIVNVTFTTPLSKQLVTFDYENMPLITFLAKVRAKAQSLNLLDEGDPILIAYYPIDENMPDDFNELTEGQDDWIGSAQLMTITLTEEDYKLAQEANQTLGRYYMMVLLEENNIEIEDDDDFIQNLYDLLLPLLKDDQQINPIDQLDIQGLSTETVTDSENDTQEDDNVSTEDDDTTNDEDAIQSTDDAADDATDDNTSEVDSDDATVDDTSDESVDEEAKQALLDQIKNQKATVDANYSNYQDSKSKCDTLEDQIAIEEAVIASENGKIDTYQSKQDEYDQIIAGFNTEIEAINERLAEKESALTQLETERSEALASVADQESEISSLRSQASSIRSSATSSLNAQATQTKQEIQEWIDYYNNLMGTALNLETLPGAYDAEIDALNNMLTIINSRSGRLTTSNDNYIGFVEAYNSEYSKYLSAISSSDSLYDQAAALQSEVDKVVNAANSDYESKSIAINELYLEDEERLETIYHYIEISSDTPEKYKSLIQDIDANILKHLTLLDEYRAALATETQRKNALYNTYLQSLETLKVLENEVEDE